MLENKKYANTFCRFTTRPPSLMKLIVILQLSLVERFILKDILNRIAKFAKKNPSPKAGV